MSSFKAKIDVEKEGGIRCPLCSFATAVKDSRPGTGNSTRRRRMCLSGRCAYRFTTFEVIMDGMPPISPEAVSTLVARVVQGVAFLDEKVRELVKGTDAAKAIHDLTRIPRE